MTTRGDIVRALLALGLASAAWLSGGCLDSIVSADCSEIGCPPESGGPDGGSDDHDRFTTGDDQNQGGGGGDGGSGGGNDAAPIDMTDAAPVDPTCEDETLEWCLGECVDTTDDPMNCGECANECESGICQDSTCLDGISGHVVLIGHDFQNKNLAIGRVLGNAVFLELGNTVDVVTYRGTADGDALANANQAITTYSAAIGRTWNRIPATSADAVPSLLATADALLVYAQDGSTPDEMTALGASWATALADFVERNGTIIVLAGGEGSEQILVGAQLMDAAPGSTVSGEVLAVANGSDAVATSVPLHYLAPPASASFTGTTAPVVVQTDSGDPVVLHRAVY